MRHEVRLFVACSVAVISARKSLACKRQKATISAARTLINCYSLCPNGCSPFRSDALVGPFCAVRLFGTNAWYPCPLANVTTDRNRHKAHVLSLHTRQCARNEQRSQAGNKYIIDMLKQTTGHAQISRNNIDFFCFVGSLVQNAICRQPMFSGCIFVLDDDANAVVHKEVLILWTRTRTQALQKPIMERLPPVPTGRGQPLIFLLSARENV